MRKSTAIALAAVTLIAITVRPSPLLSFLYWGSDTGEYFSILRALVRGGRVSTPYYGWGVTYPYFPGMFFAQAGVVDLSGLDVPTTINLLVPVLGALAVLPMFLIGRRMTGDDRFALFAAAFLAGAIPVAYTTAHTAPATVGELLAVAGLLCFVRLRTDGRAMVPLLLVTATLIATHHLSLYFFLIMVLDDRCRRARASVAVDAWREAGGGVRDRPHGRHVRLLARLRDDVPGVDPSGCEHPTVVGVARIVPGRRRSPGGNHLHPLTSWLEVPAAVSEPAPALNRVRGGGGGDLGDRRRLGRRRSARDHISGACERPPLLRPAGPPLVLLGLGPAIWRFPRGRASGEWLARCAPRFRGRRDRRGPARPDSVLTHGVPDDPPRDLRGNRVLPPTGPRRPSRRKAHPGPRGVRSPPRR